LSNNYHVRRFASEGIRPNLPWGWKVDLWIDIILKILDNLFTDHTQYVLRSVANNLNDITKLDSNKVIDKLLEWKKSWKQNEKNMLFLITHSLRTQIKSWNPKALQLLGYYMPDIKISNFNIITQKVNLWEAVEFQFDIGSNITQKLLINYKLFFVWATGKLSEKVFNISKKSLSKWENISITKKHPLKSMTTKKLYSGEHFIEIFINGESFWKSSFDFIAK
jgi:3-methyladenine DNA glycosylase AlkC